LRFIHVDEAGTSEREPVSVVVGIIVDADKQLLLAERAVEELLLSVPAEFRDGFVFHAKTLWGSERYRKRWAFADRYGLLRRMMALPRRLQLPISIGIVRRTSGRAGIKKSITTAQYHRFQAFSYCMAAADKYIRDHPGLSEVATVIAEDAPGMQKFLKAAVRLWRDNPTILPPKHVIPTEHEETQGFVEQESDYRVSRIRSTILFVTKGEDPLTQFADACAFGFRRFFAEEEFGEKFAEAILGKVPPLADYRGLSSQQTFRWHP
jgi:hypothetical protein